ncbi:YjcZ family sporulation protein [Turicibacter sanguinis]|nr:YjcZ family sporulation protein [Turicibacter sp.]MCU7191827.1 YjcZ family sporulation protein [Turicibacter sanguinis]MCU7198171.1 YjcZ family sporulation protein [Turicibacter sanguinis]MCU7202906.1 YjcZ family sporulation protein [Turicibacter sanguinis]MCU7212353.1 YjcZ family sporulation protein [Turicibacter sanguinis]
MPVYSTGSGCSNNFALILVLFILLVIIGCSHGFGGGNNSGFGCDC